MRMTCDDVRGTCITKRRRPVSATPLNVLDLPIEVIGECISYVAKSSDRFALQTSCKTLQRVTNTTEVLRGLDLVGDLHTGAGSILCRYVNDISMATSKLNDFALLGNLDALYCLGLIWTYCYEEPTSCAKGAVFFSVGASLGCLRCAYEMSKIGETTALEKDISEDQWKMLQWASHEGYLPAKVEASRGWEQLAKTLEIEMKNLKEVASILKTGFRYPEILRKGQWGEQHAAILNSKRKRFCANPECGRWSYKEKTQKRMAEKVKNDTTVCATKMHKMFALDMNQCGIAKPFTFEIEGSSALRCLKASPFHECSECDKTFYCGRTCQIVHWYNGHRKSCRRG